MKIRFHNWSGHGNLGDDEMDRILKREFANAEVAEEGEDFDWQITGGGTIIGSGSEFIRDIQEPEKTIIVSAGVYTNWKGEHRDQLMKCKAVFTRDVYSHRKLLSYGVDNKLSVDLWYMLRPSKWKPEGKTYANLVRCPNAPVESFHDSIDWTIHKLSVQDVAYFAMSNQEDRETKPEAELFTDGQALIDTLAHASCVYTTRLHATVAAWIAGVKDIRPIVYDPKVLHFLEYARTFPVQEGRDTITGHLEEIKEMIGYEN